MTDYGRLADESDKRAARLGIDPPRPGRKTYAKRYAETSALSTEEIKAQIDRRPGKENGVAFRVLANRGVR